MKIIGHKNKKSLICQVSENLNSKLAIGQSKHSDKINKINSKDKIYSYGTYNAYLQQCIQFTKWCKAEHKCKTLNDCRIYVDEYLQKNIDENKSPYTIKLQASALAKLYGCSAYDFINTPKRLRKDIKRSRATQINAKSDFEKFCICTGLRRREITALRGSALIENDGQFYIQIYNGKGGRERLAEICGTKEEIAFVVQKMKNAENNKVFSKISYTDIHAMRAAYASRIYNKYARQKSEYANERLIMYHNRVIKTYNSKNIDIKNNLEYYDYSPQTGYTLNPGYKDVRTAYYCRQDKKHICYDRLALLKCSQNLGHNRACIVADHYLWHDKTIK